MLDTVPVTFNNKEACEMVVIGFALETNKGWRVVQKSIEGNDSIWYKPCMISDLEEAKTNGWIEFIY